MSRIRCRKIYSIGAAFLAITAAAVVADDYVIPRLAETPCVYVQDLKRDPLAWREHQRLLKEDTNGYAFGVSKPDKLSMTCMACHDGYTSKSAGVKIGSSGGASALGNSHPIGMSYDGVAATKGNKYHPTDSLPATMSFISGRVGCLSCHDLASNLPVMLAVDIGGSRLCLSCHNI